MNPETLPASPAVQLFAFAATMWIIGFALSGMVGCHKGYLKATRALFVKPIKGIFKSLWKAHAKLIVGIIIGILVCLWVLSNMSEAAG